MSCHLNDFLKSQRNVARMNNCAPRFLLPLSGSREVTEGDSYTLEGENVLEVVRQNNKVLKYASMVSLNQKLSGLKTGAS